MILFRDRNLNIAILISAAWHLIFMLMVNPLLLPDNIAKNSTDISFLGSILRDVATISERQDEKDPYNVIQKLERIVSDIRLAPPEKTSKTPAIDISKDKHMPSGEKYIGKNLSMAYEKAKIKTIKFREFSIGGEARNRMLLYKPDLVYSLGDIFLNEFSSNFDTVIKFKIASYGFVEEPECIFSSGDSQIDKMAVGYLRKWQFVPLIEGELLRQEAIVKISFN